MKEVVDYCPACGGAGQGCVECAGEIEPGLVVHQVAEVVNYAHPLSELATSQLRQRIGRFEELLVPCQLNLAQPLLPQLRALVEAAPSGFDYYVPPALACAAAYFAASIARAQADPAAAWWQPQMIILKASTGVVRQYELAEII